jgi:hypothetical protein
MAAVAGVSSPIHRMFFHSREQLITPASVRLLTLRRQADCGKAETQLGYKATSIEAAFRLAYRHFVERGLIAGGRADDALAEGSRVITGEDTQH